MFAGCFKTVGLRFQVHDLTAELMRDPVALGTASGHLSDNSVCVMHESFKICGAVNFVHRLILVIIFAYNCFEARTLPQMVNVQV